MALHRTLLLVLVVLLNAACTAGMRIGATMNRRACATAAFGLASTALPAVADDKEKNKKKFEACLSLCVYEATKITKGIGQVEVMGRPEAFAMCKPKCAHEPPYHCMTGLFALMLFAFSPDAPSVTLAKMQVPSARPT